VSPTQSSKRRIVHDHFVIERVYAAPLAEVFAAWADPEIKAQWFIGPAGWQAVRRELDFRVGGEEVLHGRFATGETLFRARYHLIEAPARIVYDYDMWLSGQAHSVSLATVELLAQAPGTLLVFSEQVAFLDGTPNADNRRQGTAAHLDRITGLL
jgi:uncharacterized protein YndB with AHSA1/START domain